MLQSIYCDENEALEAVKLLVGYGCSHLEANSRGKTPLHITVERCHISAARYLLTLGASLPPDLLVISECYWSGRSAAPMIHLLIENGVDIRARTSDGDSLLHTVLQSIHGENEALEAMKLLVGYGCSHLEANSRGETPLHIAVERCHISAARYLLTLGTPLPPDLLVTLGGNWSHHSTAPGMIRFLVENGVDLLARNSDGDSVLHIVLQTSYDDDALDVVKMLVGSGCDSLEANYCGNTPLHVAVEHGNISVARYLLTLGSIVPSDLLVTLNRDWSPWNTARMLYFLVENGANALAHTNGGDSVLHIVLQSSYYDEEEGALQAVKILVGYGCDLLEVNSHGSTPFHIAVERGHISAARHLLTLGAPLPPDLLVTLNHDEGRWKTRPMIRFLVENGVDVLAHTSDGDCVLHIALQHESFFDDNEALEIVKLLVGYGCDPLKANSRGHTPLHIAVEHGHISVARYLLTLGATVPPDLLVTLNRDRRRWSTAPIIRFLVEMGADVLAHASGGDSVLHIALWSLDDDNMALETVKCLVGYGCDPLEANSHGNSPLHIAVERGHISAARYLLTLGASLPPELLVALNRDRSRWSTAPIIRFLIKNGVNVHAHARRNRDSVLHIALRCFNTKKDILHAVKLLVGYGCDPLEANSRGETPLHITAERRYVSIARYLVTQGASVLTKISNGDTVLHFAAGGVFPDPHEFDKDHDGHALEVIKFLVRCGCEPAEPNDEGKTPLHIAVDLGRIKVVNYLLSLNIPLPCDILFSAIQSDNASAHYRCIIATLVTSGCDTRTPNSDGNTPLRVAIMKGKVDVAQYLLSVANPSLEDLLSVTELAQPSVQSEMRRMLSTRLTRSESPDLPPAKRVTFS